MLIIRFIIILVAAFPILRLQRATFDAETQDKTDKRDCGKDTKS
jgi:hypothetical protein